MANLQQLEERKEELLNELSTYKWWGNEDDEDYLDEFGEEYEDLQTELNGVQEQIWEVRSKSTNVMNNNQFKTSIVAHITQMRDSYKSESDKWEAEMNQNPKLKHPRENYLQYHWEYRAFQSLLTNIEAGHYDSEEYYTKYLNPKTSLLFK